MKDEGALFHPSSFIIHHSSYVAQVSPNDEPSTYYPPRSRWHTRLLYGAGRPVRRLVHFHRLRPSVALSTLQWVLSLTVPGAAFVLLGRRPLGWLLMAVYGLAAIVFVVALGFRAAGVAYGLMIGLHASSMIFVEGLWLRDSELRVRLAMALLTLFAVWGLMYYPIVRYAQNHWFMPLRVGHRVIIVKCGLAPKSIRRGEWLAYTIPGDQFMGERERGFFLESGYGLDPVLALPGDQVRFTREALYVNDQTFPLQPHMPVQQEFVMPEKVWFIWPSLGISRGNAWTEAGISATKQRIAMVGQTNIVGRPFKHWFGRRQGP
jgi:hypothetical protein